MKGRDLYFSFLDAEKAFDKIDHKALLKAVERLGIDKHFIDVLKELYEHPIFSCKTSIANQTQKGSTLE